MERGSHITNRRKELGISSVAELAKLMGVKHQSAYQWERGGGMSEKNRSKLASILKVSKSWVEDGWKDDFVDFQALAEDAALSSAVITPQEKMIAMRIIEERARLGYSQQEFADKINMNISQLQSYELGESKMPMDFLVLIAENDININYILTGKRT